MELCELHVDSIRSLLVSLNVIKRTQLLTEYNILYMFTLLIQCKGDIDSNFTSLSSHFLTMMSSPVMSLILYIMFVADSCASRITPTIATLKEIQQALMLGLIFFKNTLSHVSMSGPSQKIWFGVCGLC